jgi:hypothetical protein
MRKKKLTKAQSKKLWLEVVDEFLGPKWDNVDMTPTIEKLKRVKFTYGGEMMTETKSHKECPYYRLARWSFPSLYHIWRTRKDMMETEMNLQEMDKDLRSGI